MPRSSDSDNKSSEDVVLVDSEELTTDESEDEFDTDPTGGHRVKGMRFSQKPRKFPPR